MRTLHEYQNYIKTTRVFDPDVINDLGKKTASSSENEGYVTILLDKMKIQEDLVWDKDSGELTGFVDLGDIYTNYVILKSVEKLANHVLFGLVKSIVNPLSYSFATFARNGLTASQIIQLFCKAVCYLELLLKLFKRYCCNS